MSDLPATIANGNPGRRKGNRVTMDEVAERANVSPSTVSLFLRDPDAVSSKRAERIREAIAETGYTINRLAGALAASHSRTVTTVFPVSCVRPISTAATRSTAMVAARAITKRVENFISSR